MRKKAPGKFIIDLYEAGRQGDRHRELRTTEIYLKSLDQSVKAAGEKLAEKLSLSHANLDEIEAKPRNDTPQSKEEGVTS